MLFQDIRTTRFRDIPLHRGRQAAKPERLHVSIPHTNEIPVANPFRQALSGRLEAMGVEVSSRINPDMIERGWNLRRTIQGGGFRVGTVSAVLSLEDQHSRVLAMHDRSSDPSSAYLEIHAYPRTESDEPFSEVYAWHRLGGTKILLMKDIPGYFSESLDGFCRAIENDPSSGEIGRFIGIDTRSMMDNTRALLREIGKRRSRIRLAEIPGDFAALEEGHHMYPYYFRSSAVTEFYLGEYEMMYCAGTFRGRETSDAEVGRIAGLFGHTEMPRA